MTEPLRPYDRLIPEMKDWNNGSGIDIDAWIACVGNFEHAIGYSRLFWPGFVLHDGCFFREQSFSENNYMEWMQQLKGDRQAVQRVMNHVHLAEVFADDKLTPTPEQLLHLGATLKDMWLTKLSRDFPVHQAAGAVYGEGEDDLRNYELTFWRVDTQDSAV